MLSTFSESLLNGGFRNTKPINRFLILHNKEKKPNKASQNISCFTFMLKCKFTADNDSNLIYLWVYLSCGRQRNTQKFVFCENWPLFRFFFNFFFAHVTFVRICNLMKKTASKSVNNFSSYKRTHIHTHITVLLRCIDKTVMCVCMYVCSFITREIIDRFWCGFFH